MKVVTSLKFEKPVLESGLVKLVPKRGGTPEFTTLCKYVDKDSNQVWVCNGPTQTIELTRSSKAEVNS